MAEEESGKALRARARQQPPEEVGARSRGADCRARPDLYRVGRGEQGVFRVEPYKSELLPLWRFRTPGVARRSAAAILRKFRAYQRAGDFVGMDMARKYLQMGWTRARRYANRRSGRKWAPDGRLLAREEDPEKAESARIFYAAYVEARNDPDYRARREAHRRAHG